MFESMANYDPEAAMAQMAMMMGQMTLVFF
jgi:hypothetical protein